MSLSRRRYLRLLSGSLGAVGLGAIAGCSSSCPDDDRPTPDQTVSITDSPAGPPAATPSGEWPRLHGNAGNSGFSAESLPDADLSVRWRTQLDLPGTDSASLSASAPVVADEMVVVASTEHVAAFSLRTGERLWRSPPLDVTFHDALYEYEANTVAPTIGPDGTVYVGTESGISALDGADGSVRWSVDGFDGVSSPAILEDTVVAQGHETVVALDTAGEERWRRSVERGETPIPVAVGADRVVAPGEGLVGLALGSGELAWERQMNLETQPVIVADTCFVGYYDGLHAVGTEAGEGKWTFSRDHMTLLSPVVAPGTIYAVEQPGEAGAASFALDAGNGEPSPRWCSYIGSGAVLAATDELALATLSLGEGPDAAPSIVAFSESLGEARWAITGESHPRGWLNPPAVVDATVIATTRGGTIVAVGGGV